MQPIFKFCPNCKSDHLEYPHGSKILCLDCNFEYYHNTAGATAVVIQKNDEILFTIRNKEPKKGFLDLAGGFIEAEETAEHGSFRELQEELNISIDLSKLKYICSHPNTYLYKNILYNTIDLFFLYKDENLSIGDYDPIELKGYVWKKLSDIDLNEIAFDSHKKTLTLLKNNLKGS